MSTANTTGIHIGKAGGVSAVPPNESQSVAVAQAEVLTAAQAKNVDEIKMRGKAILLATGQVATKYYELIMSIRVNKIPAKLVAATMAEIGFKRSRISEVNRIAAAPPEIFRSYEAKQVGFDRALNMSREVGMGEKKTRELTEGATLLLGDGAITKKDAEGYLEDEGAEPAHTRKTPDKEKLKKLAHQMAKLAKKAHTYVFDDCSFSVQLVAKPSVTKPGKDGPK